MARPRKPTGLLDVSGAFEKNPDRARPNEPKPEGEAKPPKFLKGRARRIWNEYAPQLTKLGVLTAVDSHSFAAWCCLAAELEEGPERMNASRIAQMRGLGASFGLDASARARLSVKGSDEDGAEDPASKYFSSIHTGPGNSLRQ